MACTEMYDNPDYMCRNTEIKVGEESFEGSRRSGGSDGGKIASAYTRTA